MEAVITTIEMDLDMHQWLQWYSSQNNITFSEAIQYYLTLGRQNHHEKSSPTELPLSQKLLLQCSVECLLFLKELISDERVQRTITEKAKTLIRHTLSPKG